MGIWKKLNTETGEYEEIANSDNNTIGGGSALNKSSITEAIYLNTPTYGKRVNAEVREIYKYPLYPLFGGEYLYPYYKKIFNNQNIVVACDGDSTTECAYVATGGKRHEIIEKIFRIGKYPSDKITVNNNGRGSRCSGDYVGSDFGGYGTDSTDYPNGLIEISINQNPDLIIFMHGINDCDKNSSTKTLTERITQFENNVIEFLERLRGDTSTTYNNRPCYGKTINDTCVILVNPFPYLHIGSTESDERYLWSYYTSEMLQKLARQYKCGFFDLSRVWYEHPLHAPTDLTDGNHPPAWTNSWMMSKIQELIFPMGLWKYDSEI